MTRVVVLFTVSVIALCAGGPRAHALRNPFQSGRYDPSQGTKILYSQNSNDAGTPISSQNFSSTASYNDQAADDFVVPKGHTWQITEVDVTGAYYNGSGPATSENVIFYENKNGIPGNPVSNGMFDDLNGSGGPDFALALPGKGIRLKSGRYWLSVVENADWIVQGQWGWEANAVRHAHQAVWRNPGGGFGNCTTWGLIETCLDSPGPDLMFVLRGKVR